MEVSGKPTEGWMTFVPLTVFVFVVVVALGGPVASMNTISSWVMDIVGYLFGWVRHL